MLVEPRFIFLKNGKAMKILQVSAINKEETVKITNAILITVSIALF